jgi:hypothetical protein
VLPLLAIVIGMGGFVPSLDTILVAGTGLGFSIGWIVLGLEAARSIAPAVDTRPA